LTQRNPNYKTEFSGVRHVQEVVQNMHSVYHQFLRENDQGNDCYIEFVQEGLATNYGVYVQIKSGGSYKDSKGYKIPCDKAHLEYWDRSLYHTVGIVYDPDIKKAFWVDISTYLKDNNHVLNQKHHSIRVDPTKEFSEKSFADFIAYFSRHRNEYVTYENFGRSLELFSKYREPEVCYEGLKALYTNHRDKEASWVYIVSVFGKINNEGIQRNIIGLISNYTQNPYIFWNAKNIKFYPLEEIQKCVPRIMSEFFRLDEVKQVIPYMQQGINKGSFSYLVFLVLGLIKDIDLILKEIAFQNSLQTDQRLFCFWLYLQFAKFKSIEQTLNIAAEYLVIYPDAKEDEAILGTIESIKNGDLWPVG